MRTLLLGSEHAVASALPALPPHLQLELTQVPAAGVELLRIRRLARMLRRYRPDYVISLLQPHEESAESSTEERIARLCDEGFRNLASLCTAREARLLHLSTDQVFAGSREGLFSEGDEPSPVSAAGRYARLSETAILQEDSQHIVLRTGWIMADPPGSPLQAVLDRLAAGGPSLNVADSQPFFPVSPGDVARVFGTMVHQLHLGCEAAGYFHYSASESVAWPGFVEELLQLRRKFTGAPAPDVVAGADGVDGGAPAAGAALGCKRLLGAFGIRQRHWQTELERTLGARLTVQGADGVASSRQVAEGGG